MLRTQYRCHPDIADVCSQLFYNDQILHGSSLLLRRPAFTQLPPLTVVLNEGKEVQKGSSCVNEAEARLVKDLVSAMLLSSPSTTIGVICMYKPQVALITSLLTPQLEKCQDVLRVSTVDSFQVLNAYINAPCIRSTISWASRRGKRWISLFSQRLEAKRRPSCPRPPE